jgi:hypothetical protein
MASGVVSDLDFIEELRLRRWARQNYVPAEQRQPSWHPIVLDEMGRKDEESVAEPATVFAGPTR